VLPKPTEDQTAACDVFAIYMTFNKATADDARSRFPRNVECSTAHSLAFRATGEEFRERLKRRVFRR
jgi:hypothetical protein